MWNCCKRIELIHIYVDHFSGNYQLPLLAAKEQGASNCVSLQPKNPRWLNMIVTSFACQRSFLKGGKPTFLFPDGQVRGKCLLKMDWLGRFAWSQTCQRMLYLMKYVLFLNSRWEADRTFHLTYCSMQEGAASRLLYQLCPVHFTGLLVLLLGRIASLQSTFLLLKTSKWEQFNTSIK